MGSRAAFFERLDDGRLRCGLCPHGCSLDVGDSGDCLTRRNSDGQMEVVTYGRLRAAAVDPVEKKPLFHFQPGSRTYSVASAGCNLICPFCQNHSLSQSLRRESGRIADTRRWSPLDVVEAAVESNSNSISFTYSEPILQFEFARDVAELAKPRDVQLIFVTNGQAKERPTRQISEFIAAANVDLKTFEAADYKNVLGGSFRATTRAIQLLCEANVWVEVTTLVIPGFNDSDAVLREIARFIKGVSADLPWHVSRFHPDFEWLDRGATPVATLRRAREIGRAEGLRYVYVGNLPGDEGEKTRCPHCDNVVIDRTGYNIREMATINGKCAACGTVIAGVGLS